MSTTDIKIAKWLEDLEIRAEYGSATLKYDIAAALIAARKMKNLTQIALANIAGVSQAYIAKLESGEANPTIGRIGAILAAMWLKAEINFISLVQTCDDEIAKQSNIHQGAVIDTSTRSIIERQPWFNVQQSLSLQERVFALSIAISCGRRVFDAGMTGNNNISNREETLKTISNVGFKSYSNAAHQNIMFHNFGYKYIKTNQQ